MGLLGLKKIKAQAANATDVAFPARIPTLTQPAGGLALQGGTLEVYPYGKGADNDTFSLRVIGWRLFNVNGVVLWVPKVICELAVVLSTSVGVAGGLVVAGERFADALTSTVGESTLPAVPAETPAFARVETEGYDLTEVTFKLSGTSTEMNALLAHYGKRA